MLADGVVVFVCSYDAERILSAIAKFLVHLLAEGVGRGEMGGGNEGNTVGRSRGGLEVREIYKFKITYNILTHTHTHTDFVNYLPQYNRCKGVYRLLGTITKSPKYLFMGIWLIA